MFSSICVMRRRGFFFFVLSENTLPTCIPHYFMVLRMKRLSNLDLEDTYDLSSMRELFVLQSWCRKDGEGMERGLAGAAAPPTVSRPFPVGINQRNCYLAPGLRSAFFFFFLQARSHFFPFSGVYRLSCSTYEKRSRKEIDHIPTGRSVTQHSLVSNFFHSRSIWSCLTLKVVYSPLKICITLSPLFTNHLSPETIGTYWKWLEIGTFIKALQNFKNLEFLMNCFCKW